MGHVIEHGDGLYSYQLDPSEVRETGSLGVIVRSVRGEDPSSDVERHLLVEVVGDRTEPATFFTIDPEPEQRDRMQAADLDLFARDLGLVRTVGEDDATLRARILAFYRR